MEIDGRQRRRPRKKWWDGVGVVVVE